MTATPPVPPAQEFELLHVTPGMRLRRYFLTGIVVAGPLTVTAYIVWWFINLIDGWVKPLVPAAYLPDTYLPFQLPGFGLIVAFLSLTMLGFLTANLVGRYLLAWSDLLLARMPLVSGLYKGIKQVFETVFSQSGTSFRKVGLVQFPNPGMWSFAFISTPATGVIKSALPGEDEYISVFLPCTPNPTTGFFFYLPVRDIIEIDISVDKAAKLIMSAGLIQPEEQQAKLEMLAKRSASKSA